MRGERTRNNSLMVVTSWFIPACAGNALVYPLFDAVAYGSSPHARGTHTQQLVDGCHVLVHPRMRGERDTEKPAQRIRDGSSPHARGTRHRARPRQLRQRFIPACAGNAHSGWRGRQLQAVHPRMRGERMSSKNLVARGDGSSPHARGTQRAPRTHRTGRRFIPACAGNAILVSLPTISPKVHPRMRGERIDLYIITQGPNGSSPHARGTLEETTINPLITRFIPACAGNALMESTPVGYCSVHPRMRGERWRQDPADQAQRGSSPHARGTLRGLFNPAHDRRFIPACAGNASCG